MYESEAKAQASEVTLIQALHFGGGNCPCAPLCKYIPWGQLKVVEPTED